MKKLDEKTGVSGLYSLSDLKNIIKDNQDKIVAIDNNCSKDFQAHTLLEIRQKRRETGVIQAIINKAKKDIEDGNYSDFESKSLF